MIPLDRAHIASIGLGAVALGCLIFVAGPYLSGGHRAEKRRETFAARRTTRATDRATEAASRRKQVADSLKEVEQRGRSKATLEIRIQQAGLTWTRKTFLLISVGLGAGLGAAAFVTDSGPVISACAALAGGFGLPSWILGHMKKRRLARFTDGFPGAVDIVVRGVKAGLPLGDCLRVIAVETPEPLRSEFRRVVEAQSVGLSVSEAVERLAERVPITETNFFSIVIGIQQKAGGNLTEALGNLSRVIRERKKMKAKVKAVSSEAKASASIIGALPFVVGILVWIVSPDYISLLWTTSTGRLMMGVGACWMGIGIFVMKQMINFEI